MARKPRIDIPAGFPIGGAPLPPGVVLPSRPAHAAVHQAPRPELRSGEVRGRNGEILARNNRTNDVADQFDLPLHMQEKGWSYQWVRASCHGKPDPQNVHVHEENGWRAVPSNRWPGHFHPAGFQGAVTREGMILMERPAVVTEQAIQDGIRAAKSQRRAAGWSRRVLPPGPASIASKLQHHLSHSCTTRKLQEEHTHALVDQRR